MQKVWHSDARLDRAYLPFRPLQQISLLQIGMSFYLIDCRLNFGTASRPLDIIWSALEIELSWYLRFHQILYFLPREIAHTYCSNFPLLYEIFHSSPCIFDGNVDHIN
jgi:hypothetical protein